MQILTEATPTAPKFMVYSLPGIGKTTLASKLEKSLILDIEGGANKIKTPRTTQITKLEEFYSDLVELWKAPKREFDYIVIDTVDWLVRLVINDVAGIDKNPLTETLNRSNGGYGNGKQVLDNHVRVKLLPMLIALNKKGYGICLLAHADKKTMMDSDGTTIEQIAPKIDPTTLNAFMEWCDAIFFLKKDLAGDRVLTGEWNLAKDGDINELLNKEIENE